MQLCRQDLQPIPGIKIVSQIVLVSGTTRAERDQVFSFPLWAT